MRSRTSLLASWLTVTLKWIYHCIMSKTDFWFLSDASYRILLLDPEVVVCAVYLLASCYHLSLAVVSVQACLCSWLWGFVLLIELQEIKPAPPRQRVAYIAVVDVTLLKFVYRIQNQRGLNPSARKLCPNVGGGECQAGTRDRFLGGKGSVL